MRAYPTSSLKSLVLRSSFPNVLGFSKEIGGSTRARHRRDRNRAPIKTFGGDAPRISTSVKLQLAGKILLALSALVIALR